MRTFDRLNRWADEALPVRDSMADTYEQVGAYMLALTVADADAAYLSLKTGHIALYSPEPLAAMATAIVTSSAAGFYFKRSRESRAQQ